MIRWECIKMRLNDEDAEVPVKYDLYLGDVLVGSATAIRAWGDVGWYGDVHLPFGKSHASTSVVQKDLEKVQAWVKEGVVSWVEQAFSELREEGCL